MPTQAKPEAVQKTVETVQHLIALAQDEGTTDEEARTAALRAVRLMKENSLSVIGGDASAIEEALSGAQKAVETARAEVAAERQQGKQKMILGAVAGFVLGPMLGKIR
jgi:hypothetical protein